MTALYAEMTGTEYWRSASAKIAQDGSLIG
jgi:hypothetical protein